MALNRRSKRNRGGRKRSFMTASANSRYHRSSRRRKPRFRRYFS